MNSMATIQDFLAQKRIAVVGVSHNPKTFPAHCCARCWSAGTMRYAVNPELESADDVGCFPILATSSQAWTPLCS